MNWEIKFINDEKKIVFKSDIPAIDHCFDYYKLQNWVKLMEDCLNEDVIRLGEYAKIIYPKWVDDYVSNVIVSNDCIVYYLMMDEYFEYLPKKDFEQALLAYSEKLLEIHQNNQNLTKNWSVEMKKGIENLKNKIDGYAV